MRLAPYTILVTFDIEPGKLDVFCRLASTNARASLEREPGCEVFDVLLPAGQADRVVLYERYCDHAAFGEHCRTGHFAEFDRASAAIVLAKGFAEFSAVT
jgi:(4S)-4-hydroxy-5-phosphonooxypentane-2,3-dione isomerase